MITLEILKNKILKLESKIFSNENTIALPKYYWVDESQTIANVKYYSYLLDDGSGKWWIRKEDSSTGSIISSFAKGNADYATNWTNRTSLTYSQTTTPDGSFF
jgi:hypothetical protein